MMEQKKEGSTLMPPSLSFTAATPEGSPAATRTRAASEGPSAVLPPATPSRSQSDGGKRSKRKAEDVESGGTPPKDSKATVTLDPRPHHVSHSHSTTSSHAPSSFHRQKRAKVSTTPDQSPPRPSSRAGSVIAANTGAGSSRASPPHQHTRQLSRAPSRMSQASSLPIAALVAPHAPSVARSAGGTGYHMRDPRKPPRVQPTGWGLEFGDGRWWRGGGSPMHAWLFFVGFVLFPLWWVAGLCVPVPRTRRIGGDAEEKGKAAQVVLDDPQVEFDAKSWRRRCRIMAGISLITYIPFIVLVAVFVPRSARG
ncbi:hypothetical protein DFH07DRAFT_797654 [Mycena maculata]|uniref:Uncharacterized protein n=1 Tax=Mycena maculata TaxID=230809 RepID=A0AAD7K257_9AGAR|nr:hypothetical protein DFH07DRAFT_797654 [Mycena maculata]